MKKDYIFYLAVFIYAASFLSLFFPGTIEIPPEFKRPYQIVGFITMMTPVYGRVFGWW